MGRVFAELGERVLKRDATVALLLMEGRCARVHHGAPPTIEAWSTPTCALTAEAVIATLGPPHKHDAPLLIGLPSSWCFAAAVKLDGDSEPTELLYELERKLPLGAEQMGVDFVRADGRALGVACDAGRVSPLIEAVEAMGWRVDALVPTVLLAHAAVEVPVPKSLEVWADDRGVNLLAVESGRLAAWRLAPRRVAAVRCALNSVRTNGWADAPLNLMHDDEEVRGWLEEEAVIAHAAASLLDSAVRGALRVHADERPPLNLRRAALRPSDPLRALRRPLGALVVAVVLLLAIITASLHVQAWRYGAAASASHRDLQTLYRSVYPEGALPPTVARALAIEASRIEKDRPPGPRTSAATALARLYAALPDGGNFRVDRVIVDEDQIELMGSVPSHVDAAATLNHFESQRSLDFALPELSRRADGRVEVRVSAAVDSDLPLGDRP